MNIINYGKVETIIKEIEKTFELHSCDIEEKQFVLKQINQRLLKNIQKQRTSDLVSGFGGGMFNGILKRGD